MQIEQDENSLLFEKWNHIENFTHIRTMFQHMSNLMIIGSPGVGKSLFIKDLMKGSEVSKFVINCLECNTRKKVTDRFCDIFKTDLECLKYSPT